MKNILKNNRIKALIVMMLVFIILVPVLMKVTNADNIYNIVTNKYMGGKETTGIVVTDNSYDTTGYYSYMMNSDSRGKLIRTKSIYNNSIANMPIYCLDIYQEFPTNVGSQYKKYPNLPVLNIGTIGLNRNIALNNKGKLIWSLNNMYSRKFNAEVRKNLKSELANKVFAGNLDVFKVLTDDDIEFVNQWVIWHFTSGDTLRLNTLEFEITAQGDNDTRNTVKSPVSVNLRKQYMMQLFNWYVANAKNTTENTNAVPTITNNAKITETELGVNIGNFVINYPVELKDNITNILILGEDGNVLNNTLYDILDKNGNILQTNLKENLNNEFSIRLKGKKEVKTNITIKVDYKTSETILPVYAPQINETTPDKRYQPVVGIQKTVANKNIAVKINVNTEKDLSLRQSIFSINGDETNKREMSIDTTNLYNNENLNGKDTTAIYKHAKNPIKVKKGDIVRYKVSIYNETTLPIKALEIKQYLPEGLEFVNNENNQKYKWIQNGKILTSNYMDGTNVPGIKTVNGKIVISSIDLYLDLKVKDTNNNSKVLTNIAEITKISNKDRDNVSLGNFDKLTEKELENYRGNASNKLNLVDNTYFYKGLEDDDDFEKVIVTEDPTRKDVDLALKKYITDIIKPNGNITNNVHSVTLESTASLNNSTDATYKVQKDEVVVEKNDTVRYRIDVYNEGEIKGKVQELKDNVPTGLMFIDNSEINKKYKWEYKNGIISTTYLKDRLLNEANIAGNKLDMAYVEVEFKVLVDDGKLTNTAEITKIVDEENKTVIDRDSIPNNNKDGEDDLDKDTVVVKTNIFDLALKKFITRINDVDYSKIREPKVNTESLRNNTSTNANYTKIYDAPEVVKNDVVEYTLRIYNEGNANGYATEVIDNIPTGLTFVTGNELNKKYGWFMLDKNNNVTEDINQAIKIKTNYLNNKLINAFDKETGKIYYQDIKVVFVVTNDDVRKNDTLINIAEIARIQNEKKKDVKDIDSTPDNNKDGEDDIDKEILKQRYFDLALTKRVSKSELIVNGKKTTQITNQTGNEKVKPIVKVDIPRFKMPNVEVIFTYVIKVKNEGTIEGTAGIVKDYIPSGLIFDESINNGWYKTNDGNVETTQFASKILKPGQEFEVSLNLRWDKNVNTVGNVKTNTAEIMKHINPKNVPDIDSTPGNHNPKEDDQDDVPVIISIDTGLKNTYFTISLIVLTILGSGILVIKKNILDKKVAKVIIEENK